MPTRKRKTDRKQNSACDACRLRRVKCVREQPGADCEECRRKQLQCVAMLAQKVKSSPGSRLIEARKLYGTNQSPNDDSTSLGESCKSATTSGENVDNSSILDIPQFRHLSLEEKDTLARKLVDLFSASTHFQMPGVNWPRFNEIWMAANQQYSKLAPQAQVLATYMCGFGARSSNDPLIVGCTGCPLAADINSSDYTADDLEIWGKRRQAVCQALVDYGNYLFDVRGILRTPTALCVSTALVKIASQRHLWDSVRPTEIQMTVALLKIVYFDAPQFCSTPQIASYERAESMRLSQLLLMYDSVSAARSGSTYSFTQDDLKTFCPSMLLPEEAFHVVPTPEDATSSRLKERECMVGALCTEGRFIREVLADANTPAERCKSLNTIAEFWPVLDKRCQYALSLLDRLDASQPQALKSWWKRAAHLWRWRITRTLRDRLRQWRDEEFDVEADANGATYVALLKERLFDIESQALQLLRAYTAADRESQSLMGSAINVLIATIVPMDIPLGAVDILEKPPEMLPDWSLEDQVLAAETLVKKANGMKYAWGHLESLEQGLAATEELRRRYAQSQQEPSLAPVPLDTISQQVFAFEDPLWPNQMAGLDLANLWDNRQGAYLGDVTLDLFGGQYPYPLEGFHSW